MVGTIAIPDVQICNLVIFVSHVVILELQPSTEDIAIDPDTKLTVPAVTVKPLLHVNKFVDVIVFDVIDPDVKSPVFAIDPDDKAPVFAIDPDVRAPVLVIVFDDKAPLLIIVFDCNVFSVDGPKTFRELVMLEFQMHFY